MCEFALNSTVSSATGFSPFYLNFGRNPSLPIDVAMSGVNNCTVESTSTYVKRMSEALDLAKKMLS